MLGIPSPRPMPSDHLQPCKLSFEHCCGLREFFCIRALFLQELFRLLLRLSNGFFFEFGGTVGGIREDANGGSIHFDHAAGDREEVLFSLLPNQDRSGREDTEEGNVVGKDGDFPLGSGEGHGIDVALKDGSVWCDDGEVQHNFQFSICLHLVNSPLHVESLLRDGIEVAIEDGFEAVDGLFALHEFSRRSREGFRDEEGL